MFDFLGAEEARIRDASLNADGRVVRTLSVLLGSLSSEGGFAEKSVSLLRDNLAIQARDIRLGIAEPIGSVEDFSIRWAQVLQIIAELSLCASVLASSVRVSVSGLSTEDQTTKLRTFCKDFMQSFEDSATELGVGKFFARAEDEYLFEARFLRACQELPDPTEDESAQGESWPFFSQVGAGQVSFARVPVALLPIVSEKVSFAFALLPFLGRILAYKNFATVSGAMYSLRKYFRRVHDGPVEPVGNTFEQVTVAMNEHQ